MVIRYAKVYLYQLNYEIIFLASKNQARHGIFPNTLPISYSFLMTTGHSEGVPNWMVSISWSIIASCSGASPGWRV